MDGPKGCRTFINVAEKGSYIIQECRETQEYVLWNKEKREHVTNDNHAVFFKSKEKAAAIAEELGKPRGFFELGDANGSIAIVEALQALVPADRENDAVEIDLE